MNLVPKPERKILLNPGPATTSDSVKHSMVVSDICPREKEFADLMTNIRQELVRVVTTDPEYLCVPFCGSGTAAMDAALSSIVPAGSKVLILVNGAYGERMVEIAKAYSIEHVVVGTTDGLRLDMNAYRQTLKTEKNVHAVVVIHHETTSGILNPLPEICKLAREHGALTLVDAISTYAGIPTPVKGWGIDFLLSTSNKCIQGMAGISFVIAKKSEFEKLKSCPKRNFYLNLYEQYKGFMSNGQMRFTPPVQVLYALKQALAEFFAEGGIEARYARYSANWQTLREGMLKLGFELLLEAHEESRILFSVYDPKWSAYSFDDMHDALYAKGYTIYPGKIGALKTFRLANMGDIHPQDIKNFLSELKSYVEQAQPNSLKRL